VNRLLALALLAAVTVGASFPFDAMADREAVDLLSLDVPSGWSKEVKANTFTSWTSTNKKKGTYCRIAVMLSTASKGSIEKDFEHEWKNLVAQQFGVTEAPKVTGPRTQGGWQIKNGTGPFAFDGKTSTATLSTMTGDGKTLSIVVVTNSEEYSPAIRKALDSVELKKLDAVSANAPLTAPKAEAGRIATGETPDLFPGSTGWLPSGRGVPIPAARVVNGSPVGMWWTYQLRSGKTDAVTTIFLADGTRASHPRLGGGELFDLDGQRKQQGTTGVGTFAVKDGKITQAHDGFTSTHAFTFGTKADGPWIDIGGGRYSALELITAKSLVGTWSGAGARYVFRADGTYESGHVINTTDFVAGAGGRGTWQVDGYLLALRPNDSPGWITMVGGTGKTFAVIGSGVYTRQ